MQIQASRQIPGSALPDLLKRWLEKGVVAEGMLTVDGKKLVLSGEPHVRDDADKDKDLAKGGALVEGEAVLGKYRVGKNEKSTLAIKNGANVIVVSGKLPKEQELQGTIRVVGKLCVAEQGTLVMDAEKVQAGKKQ